MVYLVQLSCLMLARLRSALVLLPLLVLPAGCGVESEEVAGGDDAAFTADDSACFEAAAKGNESATDARARCLTTQASAMLDAQIARAEDPRDAALASFKGKLRVAGETGCFSEDVSGGFLGLRQNDIDSARDVGMIAVQVKAAVEFLKFTYRDLDGYPNHFFDTVEICPNGQVGGDLRLVGSRLRIGVRTGFAGRIGIHTSTELRQLWTKGEQLEGNTALEALKGVRWAVLDPVGTPRTTLRKALRGIVTKLKTRLGSAASGNEEQTRAELTRLVRDETSGAATDDAGRNIRDRALAKIAAMSAGQLASLANDWKLALEDEDVSHGSEEGSVVMSDALAHKNVKVNVSQTGLVNVQNVHQISVDVGAFLPSAQSFTRYVEATKTETSITVNQIGIVNVQTNDIIDVRVQVLFGKATQTASLDRVLGP